MSQASAIFLTEYLTELNDGAGFLGLLSSQDVADLEAAGRPLTLAESEGLFFQGDPHTGVWVVKEGRVRTFYVGDSGREMTLAYWTPGHFVGGPEVFGGGRHVWSADAATNCSLLFLPGRVLRGLAKDRPAIALAIIDGLVAKGKCYSALVQMLGTRSIAERLTLLLRALADTHGRNVEGGRVIDRDITQEQLAMMVGATRQWVSASIKRLKDQGLLSITRKRITLHETFFETLRA